MLCPMSKRLRDLGSAFSVTGGPLGVPGWSLRFA
jgi:hypothetical protein